MVFQAQGGKLSAPDAAGVDADDPASVEHADGGPVPKDDATGGNCMEPRRPIDRS